MKKIFICSTLFVFAFGFYATERIFPQQKNLAAKFNARQQNRKPATWNGVWNYSSRFYPKSLEIKILSAKRLRFTLNSLNGANVGEINGTADVKGNKAYFDDKKNPAKDAEPFGCQLLFVNRGKFIEIEDTAECSNYGGVGVNFEGNLQKGKPPPIERNFVDLNVFPNPALDRKFKTLVGRDYENFLNSFHQIYEDTDLDGFGAKVVSACVRGICPWMAGIIMYDKKGKMWAAVIRNVDDINVTNVNYYTNVAGWKDKLPETIKNWTDEKKDSNKGLTIVYKSKK